MENKGWKLGFQRIGIRTYGFKDVEVWVLELWVEVLG